MASLLVYSSSLPSLKFCCVFRALKSSRDVYIMICSIQPQVALDSFLYGCPHSSLNHIGLSNVDLTLRLIVPYFWSLNCLERTKDRELSLWIEFAEQFGPVLQCSMTEKCPQLELTDVSWDFVSYFSTFSLNQAQGHNFT